MAGSAPGAIALAASRAAGNRAGVDAHASARHAPRRMIRALALALGQLGDPRVLRLLARSIVLTLALLAILAAAGWWLIDAGLAAGGLDQRHLFAAGGLRGALALLGVVLGGWLLWRMVAFAVLQFYADEVVEAVEARHYPAAQAAARPPGWHAELASGLRGALRTLAWNLMALPFALALLVTGLGTAVLFWAINAILIGRELAEMVAVRHRGRAGAGRRGAPPLPAARRLALGGIVAGLAIVPFVNFLAPFLGAAMATHLFHRQKGPDAAP